MLSIFEASIYLQNALALPDPETAEQIIRSGIARGELTYDSRQVTITGPNEFVITDGITPGTAESIDEDSFRAFVQARQSALTTPGLAQVAPASAPVESVYSTPWIEVMQAAIRQFFNPRPPRDPKKVEVVAWVIDEARKRGLKASENIAQAVFTIIKPEDHNPRKPR